MYDIKEYSGKIEGIIDLACSSIPETYVLPSFLKMFSHEYPEVNFSVSHYDSQYVISEILNERISFGLVGTKVNHPQVEYIDLIDDELVLAVPKNYEIVHKNGYIDHSELLKHKFIMRKEGSGTKDLIFNTLSNNNFPSNKLNILAHVESNEAIKEMVKVGLGVSFISYKSALDYIESNKINIYRVKDISFNRKFYFIYSKKKTFTPLEEKFFI